MQVKKDQGISRSTSSDCISLKTRRASLDESEELALTFKKADSHSDTNVANLIDFDDSVNIKSNDQQVGYAHDISLFVYCIYIHLNYSALLL